MSADNNSPLSGIRVLDLSTNIAGEYTGMMLGDMGADVVLLQAADTARRADDAVFLAYNRNKRSLAIDPAAEGAAQLVRDLADKVDIVIESGGSPLLDRMKLSPAELGTGNRGLIRCTVAPLTVEPEADDEALLQAATGFMSINGHPDDVPVRSGAPMVSLTSGLACVQGILAALIAREDTGEGQHVEISEHDVGLFATLHFGAAYRVAGTVIGRMGNGSPVAEPLGIFHASDGPFQLTIAGERVYRKLVIDVLDRPDLLEDPKLATNSARVINKAYTRQVFDEIFKTDTRDSWVSRMRAAKVPGGQIRTIGEAVDAPEVQERGLTTKAPHATLGEVPVVRSSIRFAGTPIREPVGAPMPGQHSKAVLKEVLGLDEAGMTKYASLVKGG